MINIRQAQPSDIREIAELWCDAFPGNRTVADRARMLETGGRYGGLETVRVARDDGGILSGACKLYRMEGHIAGAPMPLMGLAAVAVATSHRRQGLGARLCTDAIEMAARRGDAISVLYPFRPDYYERLGWGLVGERHEYRFRTEGLERYQESSGVRDAVLERDAAAIADCYQRAARRSNGLITRDREVWAYRLTGAEFGVLPADANPLRSAAADPRRHAVVYEEHGEDDVSGYALLQYGTGPGDVPKLEVRELVAESERAYRGLVGYIAGRADQWPLARHFARPEERFGDRLADPRPPREGRSRSLSFPTARIVRGPMLRVLDVPAALRLRPWFQGEEGLPGAGLANGLSIRIAVEDAQRPENGGPWRVMVRPGAGEPEVLREDQRGPEDAPAAALSTDAATFARIFAGEIGAADASRLGRAAVEGDVRLLDRAFATRERFWLLDEF